MRYLSLFSGIEACTVAWKSLGWAPVAFAEIDPFCSAVLGEHYPMVKNLGDVRAITDEQVQALGPVDVVVGGSPCTDISRAKNHGKGLNGENSGLFFELVRIFNAAREHCGARWLVWENVPGIFSVNNGADFSAVVAALGGYYKPYAKSWGNEGVATGTNGELIEWRILDAQDFGLPQRRKRVFVVCDCDAWRSRPPVLLKCESGPGDSEESGGAQSIDAPRGQAGAHKGGSGVEECYYIHGFQHPITTKGIANPLGRNNGLENVMVMKVGEDWEVRRMTPEEGEMWQGFPPGYTKIAYSGKSAKNCPPSQRYKALGNSMAVPVVAWIGKQIQAAHTYQER